MTTTNHRRVAIWCAVSSPQQARIDKDSLPSQERDGRAWADANGYVVAATYKVPGHTRKYIFYADAAEGMDAYRRLREDANDGKFDVLWCRARDRLGRTDALIAQVEAIVTEAGAQVYSAFMPHSLDNASDASAIILSSVERGMAQAEGVQRESRRMVGVRKRIADGLHPSTWPLGYAAVRDDKGNCTAAKLVDDERAALEMMTRLFLDGVTYMEMVARMRESPYRPRGGGGWARSTVRDRMLDDIYAGYVSYGGIRATEKSDKFPALWDEETYQAIIRERIARHQDAYGGPPSSPLTGMVICARCGWKMRVKRASTKAYFCCNKHSSQVVHGPCHPNYISLPYVEHWVEERLAALATDEAIDEFLSADAPDAAQLARDLGAAQRRVEVLATKEASLLLLQAQASDAGFTRAMEMLAVDQAAATAALVEAEAAARSVPDLSVRREALHQFRDLAALGLEPGWLRDAGIRESRHVLLAAGVVVYVEDGKILPGSFGA